MHLLAVLVFALLAGCVASPQAKVSMGQTPSASALNGRADLPTQQFGLTAPPIIVHTNADLGRDFLDLAFAMENGRALPVLSRFEGPISVRMVGPVPPSAPTDLARLLHRFRTEAGLDIHQIAAGPTAITIEFVPRKAIQSTYADVACFIVPRVSSWQDFRAARITSTLDWTTLHQRDTVSVFIPADSPDQDVHDCLHEEVAQAIGPLNDLFRLTDSVFNDDNFNTSLTHFDMTILRAYYAPELRSGMTKTEVAAKLPGVLTRINPDGGRTAHRPQSGSPRAWIEAIQTSLGANASAARRKTAAQQAIAIAQAQGWTDGRLAFSYFALGRSAVAQDHTTAIEAFANAGRIYRSLPGGAIHAAHVDLQLAAFALSQNQADTAIEIANRAIPIATVAESAPLVTSLLLIKAEALEMLGRGQEAAAVRIDSRGWARYGFGSDAQIKARAAEISALAPRSNKS